MSFLNAPTFRWSDNALNELPLDERRHLQSRIEKICGELCISEGIFGWGQNRRPAQKPGVVQAVIQSIEEPAHPHCCVRTVSESHLLMVLGIFAERKADSPNCCKD